MPDLLRIKEVCPIVIARIREESSWYPDRESLIGPTFELLRAEPANALPAPFQFLNLAENAFGAESIYGAIYFEKSRLSFRYLRDVMNIPRVTLAIAQLGDRTHIGMAVCSPLDAPCLARGRQEALSHLADAVIAYEEGKLASNPVNKKAQRVLYTVYPNKAADWPLGGKIQYHSLTLPPGYAIL